MKHGALSRVLHRLQLHSMPHIGFPYAHHTKYPPSSGLQSVQSPLPMSPHIYSTSHGLLPRVSSFKPRSLPLPMPTLSPSPADFVFTVLTAPEYFLQHSSSAVCLSTGKTIIFPSMSPTPGLVLGVWCAGTLAGHAAGDTECRNWGLVGLAP